MAEKQEQREEHTGHRNNQLQSHPQDSYSLEEQLQYCILVCRNIHFKWMEND